MLLNSQQTVWSVNNYVGLVNLDKTDIGLGNVLNVEQIPASYLDTDVLLGGLLASDTKVPSQLAVYTFVNTLIAGIPNPMIFKGTIDIPADFPTLLLVQNGWTYHIGTNVTDSDVTKTNTGLSFSSGDEIAWNGVTWVTLGSTALWTRTGTTLYPATLNDNIDIGTGTYKGIWDGAIIPNTKLGNGLTDTKVPYMGATYLLDSGLTWDNTNS